LITVTRPSSSPKKTLLTSIVNPVTPAEAPGGAVDYGPNGNLASYGGWSYGYDADNRLISATGGGHIVTFVYDGLGAACNGRSMA
jgi:hypothetical protein